MDELACPCVFHLPLAFNDGSRVPKRMLVSVYKAIDRQFGGKTILGTVEGSWHGQVEVMQAIKVTVPSDQVDALIGFVRIVGRDFGQEKMYFERGDPTAMFLDPAGDEPNPAG